MNSSPDPVARMGEVILDQARQEVSQLLSAAQEDAREIEKATEQEASQYILEMGESTKKQTTREVRKRLAVADLEAKRMVWEVREDVLNHCFSILQSKLKEMTAQSHYPDIIARLVIEAAYSLQQSEIVLEVRSSDRDLLDSEWLKTSE